MTLELLKITVQATFLERDRDGKITGERLSEPVPLYDDGDYQTFRERLLDELEKANAAVNGDNPKA